MEHRKSRLLTSAFLKFIAVILAVICFAGCFFSGALTVTAIKSNVYNDRGAELLEDSIAGRTESLFYAFSRSLWYGNYEYVAEEALNEEGSDAEANASAATSGELVSAAELENGYVISEPKRLKREQLDDMLPNSIRPENSDYLFVIYDADGRAVYTSAEISEEDIEKNYDELADYQYLTLKVRDLSPTELCRSCKTLDEVQEMLGVYRHFTGGIYVVSSTDEGESYTTECAAWLKDGSIDEQAEVWQNDGINALMVCLFADKMLEDDVKFLSTDYNDFLFEHAEYSADSWRGDQSDIILPKEISNKYDEWAIMRQAENKKSLGLYYDEFYDSVCRELSDRGLDRYISYIPRSLSMSGYDDVLYNIIVDGSLTLSYELVGTYYAYPGQEFSVKTYYSLKPTHGDSIKYTAESVEFVADCAKFFPLFTLIFGALLLMLLFYLVLAAGERRGHETATACWFDMIPIELFAIADIVAAVYLVQEYLVLVYELVFTNYSTYRLVHLAVLALLPFAVGLVGVLSLMTFSTRVKAHVLLKYSFVGVGIWLIKTVWKYTKVVAKYFGYILSKIPMVWQCAIAIPALMFLDLFCAAMMFDGADGFVLIWLMMWAAVALFTLNWCIGFKRIQKYAKGMKNGDISKKIDKKYMNAPLKRHAENLEGVDEGIKKAVDERMKSERFKTELIANVSHDLKTPLTSIVNYVDILSKDKIESPEAKEHICILKRQAARMKKLIEDLVEVSKASSGTISADLERTDVNLLVTQTATEYAQRFENGKLDLVMTMPDKKQIAELDGRLMWRVLDNLCNNICKYALAGTRVYISAEDMGESVRVSFRNISRACLNMTGDELMERFVRGDSSRNTEGSGLGLSIAKSFCELQKVGFDIVVDGDLFKVSLTIPKAADVETEADTDVFTEQDDANRAAPQCAYTVEEDAESEENLPICETPTLAQNEPIMIPALPENDGEAGPTAPEMAEIEENPALFDEKEGTTEE